MAGYPAGGSPNNAQYRLQGGGAEGIVCHLIEARGRGIEGNARSRHFDHTNVVFAISYCHGVGQADAETV